MEEFVPAQAVSAPISTRSLMTAEELVDLPDDDFRYELVNGVLARMTPTGAEHGVVAARTGQFLSEHVSAFGLGVCCGAETGFILRRAPDVVRAPDAGFVSQRRIPEPGVPTGYWPFAPDLAVEVVSPTDRPTDLRAKIGEYFSAGSQQVWVVEPATRTVHAYRGPHDVQVFGIDDELTGDEMLPGFRCPVGRLFP